MVTGKLRTNVLAAVAVLAVVATHVVVTARPARADTLGPFVVQAFEERGACLDADSDTVNRDGGKAQVWSCNGLRWQNWFFDETETPGQYMMRSGASNSRCLDADNSVAFHNKLQIWGCFIGRRHDNQYWSLVRNPLGRGYSLVSALNGRCAQVERNDFRRGSTLFLAECDQFSVQQRWLLADPRSIGEPAPCPPACNQRPAAVRRG
jgi:Ricin-type beta-trefoil lectin domain